MSETPDTYELEAPEPDVCPSCSAPMPGAGDLVCIRCGFDQRTLETIDTKESVTETAADEDDQPAMPGKPIAARSALDPWLGLAVFVAAVGLLTSAHAMGWRGVTPRADVAGGYEAVTIGTVIMAGLKRIALTVIWSICGVGGLIVAAHILTRPITSLTTAWSRMLAVVGVGMLARLIWLPQWAEGAVELVVGLGLATAAMVVLFRLAPRNAGIVLVTGLGFAIILHVSSWMVVWAAA